MFASTVLLRRAWNCGSIEVMMVFGCTTPSRMPSFMLAIAWSIHAGSRPRRFRKASYCFGVVSGWLPVPLA